MRTYPIFSRIRSLGSKAFRDLPEGVKPPIQTEYFDLMMGTFLKNLAKFYASEAPTAADKEKLKRYFDRIIEAKSAAVGEEPQGGFYKRSV